MTDISGRGVGMDVVRKQMQKLRGRVDIQSRPGKGTTFLLKLPLTLAIIDGLGGGRGRGALHRADVRGERNAPPHRGAISPFEGRDEMVLVRGTLLPVVRLHRRFRIEPRTENPSDSLLIVAENGGKQFCLMVDELMGKQEVVIKSLGEACAIFRASPAAPFWAMAAWA